MAGYSGTPLPQKLGIKPGASVCVMAAPAGFDATLGDLPEGARMASDADARADVLICFVTQPGEVEQGLLALKPRLAWTGGLWFAWPKRTSKLSTGLDENTVREIGLAAGLVDNKVCAIDDDWSGLRFVWRLADRPKEPKAAARSEK